MKNLKKIAAGLTAVSMMAGLTACGGGGEGAAVEETTVTTTTQATVEINTQELSEEEAEQVAGVAEQLTGELENKTIKWFSFYDPFHATTAGNRKALSLELFEEKYGGEIIPCYIDTNLFEYQEKDVDLRKKIFILRRFTNDCCYALDIDIRAILELSTRPYFNDLEFDIYGDGEMFEVLTQPLKNFSNVHLHREFLSHEDIKKVQDTHGIGLFASRFDTQGVSLCEAAASGCAVVTSNIPAIKSYIDPKLGVTCEVENFREYADVIEKLYNDPDYFSYVSKSQHKSIIEKFNYSNTIEKELNIFKNTENKKIEFKEPDDEPILTVIVPAYNVEQYLMHGVKSLLNQPYANKLEILIVNDGSHDATEKIANELQAKTTINGKSIVRLINKENGGHGSTINRGIKEAKGKYLKVMDMS